ncbi:hypothetical protein RHMOL_Rhmol01G0152500 [Rhododendron molle]|uniref:Uncharacterized protein n=1 Tax=Rhododendron molle TaxID=49168 RepID=A0ACC0Q3N2_RHOML|nr:hypothetical protein RHMOL_Rhmol01G0152500 [Rhododendron molle]
MDRITTVLGSAIMDINDDNNSPKPSYNKGKNVVTSRHPWVKKYRPQSLADVAAHRDIVDTSQGLHLFLGIYRLFVVELAISDIRCPNFDGLNEIKGLKVDVSSVETDIDGDVDVTSGVSCMSHLLIPMSGAKVLYIAKCYTVHHTRTRGPVRMNGMNSGLLSNGMDRVSSPRAGFLGFLKHLKEDMKLSYLAQELISTDRVAPQSWCAMGNCYSLQKDHETALKNFQAQVTNRYGGIARTINPISIWHPRGPDSFVSPGCIAVPSFEEPDSDLVYCVVESIAEETVFEDQKIWSAPD